MSDKILAEAEYWKERSRLAEDYIGHLPVNTEDEGEERAAYYAWRKFANNEPIPMPAAPTSEWISVKDMLPESKFDDGSDRQFSPKVLTVDPMRRCRVGFFDHGTRLWRIEGEDRTVTHWRELPDPPSIPQGEEQTEQR